MTIKLISYNILDGGADRQHLILEVLKSIPANIILLQEVVDVSLIEMLSRELDMNFFVAEGNSKRKLAALANLPIVSQSSYHPFPLWNSLLDIAVEYAPRKYLSIFGAHLAPYPLFVFEFWRFWEIKKILQRVSEREAERFILVGDFNAVAPSDLVDLEQMPNKLKVMIFLQGGRILRRTIARILQFGLIDCYRTLQPNQSGYTFPAIAPHIRLDYVFVNQTLKNCIKSCDVITLPTVVRHASDHLPIFVELEIFP